MKNRLSLLSAALVLASAPASADIVHLDDVIIDGSLCVGFDCVNGEAFGFDTIRLKENNLRIKFQDTSSSASFPTNDWQLTANDSSNGGANKFSIDDIDGGRTPFTVEAGARTNALYVEIDGDVGFGTNNPVVDLHVVTGNTPTLRLEQDGSSGFSPQTWDVAGNEAGFFIRDATNGSTLPFRILPGASSQSLVIDGNDDVGIGAGTNPAAPLHLRRTDGSAAVLIEETSGTPANRNLVRLINNGATFIQMEDTSDSVIWDLGVQTNDTFRINKIGTGGSNFSFKHDTQSYLGIDNDDPSHPIHHSTGARLTAAGVWTNASSRALKKDIRPIDPTEAMDALNNLEPVTYTYYTQEGEIYAGFIAEDVPEIVATNDRQTLSPMDIVAILTKALQVNNQTIKALEERIKSLETSTN